ncbi:helix-turn-helix transcriptional regulator [Paenibacillus sp. GD4]|uniref:helix-turn-helix domain-containing protein n=1 Tax=Paenibacillus sp. GD4 TaxID=3068890 RepID=UPI0027968D34|nr:helix-turn-helix transcriptional regulator [Paenibacillus sp. GD4]MDQ1912514.1 helix-turn-helix transcriptional regulator [Paenibacillus sp. GD4]
MKHLDGSEIRLIRRTAGLTQTEFGNRIGLSYSTISKIERGDLAATEETVSHICRVFNVDKERLRALKSAVKPFGEGGV